jgi:S1-C subfamily serine protease
MSDQICFYDTNKKAFALGDPDYTGFSWASLFSPKNDTTASVYRGLEKSSPWVIAYRAGAGSGVVMEQKDQVATDVHVALQSDRLKVMAPSGKILDATISNLDVLSETAILNVPGLSDEGASPAKINTDAMSLINEPVFGIGLPLTGIGLGTGKCISGGTVTEISSEYGKYREKGFDVSGPSQLKYFKDFWATGNPAVASYIDQQGDASLEAAEKFMKRPLIFSDAHGENGMSGGPLADKDHRAAGLLDEVMFERIASTPMQKAVALANAAPRFKFEYEYKPFPVLKDIKAINPSDNYEAGLANAIMNRLN